MISIAFIDSRAPRLRTSFLVNVADALAIQGRNVLMIDLDFETPAVPTISSSGADSTPLFQPEWIHCLSGNGHTMAQQHGGSDAQIPLPGFAQCIDQRGRFALDAEQVTYEVRTSAQHPLEGRLFFVPVGGFFLKTAAADDPKVTRWVYSRPTETELRTLGQHFVSDLRELTEAIVEHVKRRAAAQVDVVLFDGPVSVQQRLLLTADAVDEVILVGESSRSGQQGLLDLAKTICLPAETRDSASTPPIAAIVIRTDDVHAQANAGAPTPGTGRGLADPDLSAEWRDLVAAAEPEMRLPHRDDADCARLFRQCYADLSEIAWPSDIDVDASNSGRKYVSPLMALPRSNDLAADERSYTLRRAAWGKGTEFELEPGGPAMLAVIRLSCHIRTLDPDDAARHAHDLLWGKSEAGVQTNPGLDDWQSLWCVARKQFEDRRRLQDHAAADDRSDGASGDSPGSGLEPRASDTNDRRVADEEAAAVLSRLSQIERLQEEHVRRLPDRGGPADWDGDWRLGFVRSFLVDGREAERACSTVLSGLQWLRTHPASAYWGIHDEALSAVEVQMHTRMAVLRRAANDMRGAWVAYDQALSSVDAVHFVPLAIRVSAFLTDCVERHHAGAPNFLKEFAERHLRPRLSNRSARRGLLVPYALARLQEFWCETAHDARRTANSEADRALDDALKALHGWEDIMVRADMNSDERAEGLFLHGVALLELAACREPGPLRNESIVHALEKLEQVVHLEENRLDYYFHLAVARVLRLRVMDARPLRTSEAWPAASEKEIRGRDCFYAFEQAKAIWNDHAEPTFYYTADDALELSKRPASALLQLAEEADELRPCRDRAVRWLREYAAAESPDHRQIRELVRIGHK
jgi:hypothetical protein